MSFAIIETGGKQYKVQAGDKIKVEKLTPTGASGLEAKVVFDTLLVDDGKTTKLGKEAAKAKIDAEIVGQGRGEKISVIHYKSKVRYYKKRGHRQLFTEVKIGEIK